MSIVEYWRNRYQRMNTERFFAANTIALITHGIVSNLSDLMIFRPNHLISSKPDLKCFKREKVTLALDSREVSTDQRYSMKFTTLEGAKESSTLKWMLSS